MLNLSSYGASTFGDLEIDAPNLKAFSFLGRFSSICFKNASLLKEVSIDLQDFTISDTNGNSELIKVLGELSSITRLKSNYGFLQFLARGGVPQKLPINLNNPTVLRLGMMIGSVYSSEVRCALCLIKSAPNLQFLQITLPNYTPKVDQESALFLKAQQKSKIPLSRLELVRIKRFSGAKSEMEFVKLLLLSAIALRKLEISINYRGATVSGYKMLKELLSFRRASSKAEIIFKDVSGI
ncbi:hypothetical protein Salat_0593400 [Sesamum alatum]|uniref:FBD domain-containing protein n=1 Tax=Sesamum alatum TaxID=300844 RepID=A0AAE1YQ48_9LAMI|nr:hypothetical protein Salat_0593400 [Sesamum alatum]